MESNKCYKTELKGVQMTVNLNWWFDEFGCSDRGKIKMAAVLMAIKNNADNLTMIEEFELTPDMFDTLELIGAIKKLDPRWEMTDFGRELLERIEKEFLGRLLEDEFHTLLWSHSKENPRLFNDNNECVMESMKELIIR